MNIIEVKGLTKVIDKQIILDDVNFEIKAGTLNFLIGDSGSGKTTFFFLLAGMDQNYDGKIFINQKANLNVFKNNKYLQDTMTIIFQNYNLNEDWTVKKNLEITNKELDNQLLNDLGIINLVNKKIYQLSGGEQQRVAIARSLMLDTKIILCDEPTGNLDQENTIKIINILQKIVERYNKTVIIITHNKAILQDNVYKIDNKKIIKITNK